MRFLALTDELTNDGPSVAAVASGTTFLDSLVWRFMIVLTGISVQFEDEEDEEEAVDESDVSSC